MLERVAYPSEEYSEEKTEPFPESEIHARLKSFLVEEHDTGVSHAVPLDRLVVDEQHSNVRTLIRPLARRSMSPGNDCKWLGLHAEIADAESPEHKVLAVTQSHRDIKFTVRIPGPHPDDLVWCELYYDPASDNQILLNRCDVPIVLSRTFSQESGMVASPGGDHVVNPGNPKALSPGTWRIQLNNQDILDFRILEKRPAMLRQTSSLPSSENSVVSDVVNSSGKRSFVEDGDAQGEKRLRITDNTGNYSRPDGNGVIMFLRPTEEPLVFPLPGAGGQQGAANRSTDMELVTSNGNPLLGRDAEDTVVLPEGCEIDKYTLTKGKDLHSTQLSSVFTARHSNVPDGVVTVKVLKTHVAPSQRREPRPQEQERNVIRQADIWLREFRTQEDLEHPQLVKLWGGDARYLSLYMEHVDAPDLSARDLWRSRGDDLFTGSRNDAIRILKDLTRALHYIHGRKLVHNDIKPANILYSPKRGAVLCDFGLSTPAANKVSPGGTPYYVPPEFIRGKTRGMPSDVWAMGVTMLYVLRKIPFPESRGRQTHRRPLYWQIAEVNNPRLQARGHGGPSHAQGQPTALEQMQLWLSEVRAAREQLNKTGDPLERLVYGMLAGVPKDRITVDQLLVQLFDKPVDK